eukprot:CAMPEP_0176328048 /NCGR_PEP_ID=MMETSP0121_2-20121125/74762_1 /TAXON_ID=160619 /ORGANISM="Kryptoperidinium foliaceum, Strain CCMP 1326" /LENGTH=45 /DNA_ID= /DNA_START= /DNA_END= /DNA_ORIENTATION=
MALWICGVSPGDGASNVSTPVHSHRSRSLVVASPEEASVPSEAVV